MPTKSVFFFETAGKVRRHRGHGPIRILPDDDVTLLGAKNVHGLRAIDAGAERFGIGPDRFEHRLAVIGRHIDFEAGFTGEGDTEEPRRHPADRALGHAHMREGLVRKIEPFDQRRDDLTRLRALHGDDSPLFGHRGQPDLQMREFRLQVIFHVMEHARRAAGRRRHMETVVRQASDNTVVINEAVLAGHDAVAGLAGLQRVLHWCR